MQESILDLQDYEVKCLTCAHWDEDYRKPIYGKLDRGLHKIGQCLCTENGAPFVNDLEGPEPCVFTQADSWCRAWEEHKDMKAERLANRNNPGPARPGADYPGSMVR